MGGTFLVAVDNKNDANLPYIGRNDRILRKSRPSEEDFA